MKKIMAELGFKGQADDLVSASQDRFMNLRGKLVEIFSPFPYIAFGQYQGINSREMMSFRPNILRQVYPFGSETKILFEQNTTDSIQIPDTPQNMLIPREKEYVDKMLALNRGIIVPSNSEIQKILRQMKVLREEVQNGNPRALRHLDNLT